MENALQILSESRVLAMKKSLEKCEKCPLFEGNNLVFGIGKLQSPDIMFVGEAPGAEEDQIGEPFRGKAGKLLDKMIGAIGYRREDIYTDNIVKHRPPNNRKPTRVEGEACVTHLIEQIELINPITIVCVGATAAEHLLRLKSPMYMMRGVWHQYRGIPARIIYHPAYLLRLYGQELDEKKRETWLDLQEVRSLINKIKSGDMA